MYTVTGQRPDEEQVEQLIETGESETIFQKAILEQGRGQVTDEVMSGAGKGRPSLLRRRLLLQGRWQAPCVAAWSPSKNGRLSRAAGSPWSLSAAGGRAADISVDAGLGRRIGRMDAPDCQLPLTLDLCLGSKVADTVAEIQERHEAVKELEKSLLDLHQVTPADSCLPSPRSLHHLSPLLAGPQQE